MISKYLLIKGNSVQSIWKEEKAKSILKLSNGSMEIIQIIIMKRKFLKYVPCDIRIERQDS